jgi:hypothetical protein
MSYTDSCRAVSIPAAIDVSSFLGHFGIINSAGRFTSGTTTLTAQGVVNGIISEASATALDDPVTVTVPDGGITKVKLGATMTAGDPVATAADGRAIDPTAAAGSRTWGTLLESGVADDIVAMQFCLTYVHPGT